MTMQFFFILYIASFGVFRQAMGQRASAYDTFNKLHLTKRDVITNGSHPEGEGIIYYIWTDFNKALEVPLHYIWQMGDGIEWAVTKIWGRDNRTDDDNHWASDHHRRLQDDDSDHSSESHHGTDKSTGGPTTEKDKSSRSEESQHTSNPTSHSSTTPRSSED